MRTGVLLVLAAPLCFYRSSVSNFTIIINNNNNNNNNNINESKTYLATRAPAGRPKGVKIRRDNVNLPITIQESIHAYGQMGHYDRVAEILDDVSSTSSSILPQACSLAVSCFGKAGHLHFMELTVHKMASMGISVDSVTANKFLEYSSLYGSLAQMETAYARLKRSRLLIEPQAIRAMSLAYIRNHNFYRLGEFLRDVGLNRSNVGNMLWNFLLLSYAANFKMKSLQREFLRMLDAGFTPDITTFNIRALAFSRMSLFWDLHLTLEHMKRERVVPDTVTYGCVVDAYVDRKLGRNLDFALNKMNLDDSPKVLTDPFVFEVLGKGYFHSSSEAFLEFKGQRHWTYRKLVAVYLKKQYRSNQIFWNY